MECVMGNLFGNGKQHGMTTVQGPLLAVLRQWPQEPIPSVHLNEPEGGGAELVVHDQSSTWDAMESYFECITTCSLEDGECVTRCVEELREKA
jgi:hypothetical protein